MAKRSTRRRFLGRSLALLPAGVLPAAAQAPASHFPEREMVLALAEVVLPTTGLEAAGVAQAATGFVRWAEGFVPVAELDHPYLSDHITYGPPDPRPMWRAQLQALQLEARQRHGAGFPALAKAAREAIVRGQLARFLGTLNAGALPPARDAQHVAIALVAWYASTPAANDLCYRAAIQRYACRGIDQAGAEPAPQGATAPDPRVGS